MEYKYEYREEDGIKIFSNQDYYWYNQLPRETLGLIHETVKNGGSLVEACLKYGINYNYLSSYHRSDFIYFLPNKNGASILDLGSGYGNITIPLAKHMGDSKIYAVDASLDILKFLKLKAENEGCKNIECVKTDVFEKMDLPFRKQTFDIIIMNGVLEWIGCNTSMKPRESQIKFLEYIKSLLKDDGVLYIGIEGRLFPGYFKDVKDPHSKLMYTSIVPRFVADLIAKWNGHKDGYRTYTYTLRGYFKMFKQSGYNQNSIRVIYPIASYKDPAYLFFHHLKVAYEYCFEKLDKAIFPTQRNRIIYKTLRFLRLEKVFAPSYLFLLGEDESLLLDKYFKMLIGKNDTYQPIKIFSNTSNSGFANFLMLNPTTGEVDYLVKIKRDARIEKTNLNNIQRLIDAKTPNVVLPIAQNESCQIYKYLKNKKIARNLKSVESAVELIKTFHRSYTKGTTKMPSGYLASTGLTHGDFTLDNLIEVEGCLFVVDLERLDYDGMQIFDVFNLLVHFALHVEKVEVEKLSQFLLSDTSTRIIKLFDNEITKDAIKECMLEYCERYIVLNHGVKVSHEKLFLKLRDELKNS